MPLSQQQRRHRARIAAFASHANSTDPVSRTAAARQAFYQRFIRQADPDGLLPEAERLRRAEQLFQAHMARLALQSARSREAARDARRRRVARGLQAVTVAGAPVAAA